MNRKSVTGGVMAHRSYSYRGRGESVAPAEFEALLAASLTTSEARRADELLEWIEDYEASARFVPDWADESFRNAA
jgi:hypothetical protein